MRSRSCRGAPYSGAPKLHGVLAVNCGHSVAYVSGALVGSVGAHVELAGVLKSMCKCARHSVVQAQTYHAGDGVVDGRAG